jgi:hypothetical protein
MNNAQGGYKIIDFKGIDLINEEIPNTSIYKAIEESYKSKALLLTNIVIDKVEYNAVFKEIKHIDNYYTFEVYDRIIKVYADKVESLPKFEIKTIDYTQIPIGDSRRKTIEISPHNQQIIINNFEPKSILDIYLGGISQKTPYSFFISSPFLLIDTAPTLSTDVSIKSYNNVVNNDNTFTSDIMLEIINKTTVNTLIIKVNCIDNVYFLNFINGMEL